MKNQKNRFFKSKKGVVTEIAYFVLFLFIAAVVIMITAKVYTSLQDGIQSSSLQSANTDALFQKTDNAYKTFDSMFLVLVVGLCIGIIISAFFINSHPIFYVITILLWPIVVIISAALSNAYESLMAVSAMQQSTISMTTIPFVLDKLPYISIILSILIMVAMYAKGDGAY